MPGKPPPPRQKKQTNSKAKPPPPAARGRNHDRGPPPAMPGPLPDDTDDLVPPPLLSSRTVPRLAPQPSRLHDVDLPVSDDEDDYDDETEQIAIPPEQLEEVEAEVEVQGEAVQTTTFKRHGTTKKKFLAKDILREGYAMKRVGAGATHYWYVRFFSLERVDQKHIFHCFTSQTKETRKAKITILPGVSNCMLFERDCYDEGKRKFPWGVQAKTGGKICVLDAVSAEDRQAWIDIITKTAGCADLGLQHADKVNPESVREGWITKKPGTLGSWKRRYLVLLPQMLLYYRWKRDKRPLGVIVLTKKTEISLENQRPHSFGLQLETGRKYVISSHDDLGVRMWCNDVQACLQKLK